MDKLKMTTADKVDVNIEKIEILFPNCVTERVDESGNVEKAIDFDMLKQELSHVVVDGAQERYQFTWPDKKKSILLSNAPINKTLRPVVCDEQVPTGADTSGRSYMSSGSVGRNGEAGKFDSENLYIEGDNLDVLKLLQETYLGKVKMIYIDPPYNTGNDFVYEDDFSMRNAEFAMLNEDVDEDGNRMVLNAESNGRFHTDWLNMIYPRLKLAKDLLTDDGVIFISIDDNEQANMKKMCDEVFGAGNFGADFIWNSTKSVTNTALVSVSHTYNIVYFKNIKYYILNREEFRLPDDGSGFENLDDDVRGPWKADPFQVGGWRPNQQYIIINPNTGMEYKPNIGCSWKNDYAKFQELLKDNRIVFGKTGESGPQRKRYIWEAQERGKVVKTWWDDVETTTNGTQLLKKMFDGISIFDNPKPISLINKFLQLSTDKNDLVLDFFSGSATTAHAVMQLNAEDGGNRKFIMVQLPEVTDEKSEAFKAGYKNICEIGKERIRRAGKKIKADRNIKIDIEKNKLMERKQLDGGTVEDKYGIKVTPAPDDDILDNLDIGFRVLKLDTSNMKDVYYRAENYSQSLLDTLEGNIKADRTPQDLLVQVMLDMGVLLSSKIEERKLAMQNEQCVMVNAQCATIDEQNCSNITTIYIVGEYSSNVQPNLIACFDDNLSNEVVTAIAKMKPLYAVFRDSSFANDSVATNFEQIFSTYSPTTIRKVL